MRKWHYQGLQESPGFGQKKEVGGILQAGGRSLANVKSVETTWQVEGTIRSSMWLESGELVELTLSQER